MASIASYACRFKRGLAISSTVIPGIDAGLIEAISRSVGHRFRRRFWSPGVLVLTFLRQVLQGNCACREAVAMTLAQSRPRDPASGGQGGNRVSADPSAYVQARARLPLAWFAELHRRVADGLRERVADARRWCGRRVYIIDGSTLSMPDTPELQGAFAQPYGQKPGCGFPLARLTAIFCHASGALLDLAADSYRITEQALLRKMLRRFRPGDVILADRGFHGYADLVGFVRHGLAVVIRLNEAAWPDLRPLRRLSHDDQIAVWHRPRHRTRRLTRQAWVNLPETMTVRLVRCRVDTPGFRSRRIELLTTLLDDRTVPTAELLRLYRDRWLAELNLRSLKTTLGMNVLKGKTPDIVHKEILMYAVAYNLIRTLMWDAARRHDRDPRRLSFAGTVQHVRAELPYLGIGDRSNRGSNAPRRDSVLQRDQRRRVQRLLAWIAADVLPDRPDRIEPRAVKRRPKSYVPLSIPRDQYRRKLLKIQAA